jgi:hypothetical protein
MVNIATMGMFRSCCGTQVGGGGAPPYRPYNDEPVKPLVLVKHLEVKTINDTDDLIGKIKVKFRDD